ncbi:FabD/lysophospholipase-like protein [Lojkania enalia]|uniref:FabD/lysophospholipase-like protein n=1 Tax=Lojkania enalia TaxID=147567 RepID=A0A9P4N5A4_9PLEO|nr:FabD/lysophospholipase-like protein [Didymosphaeria enalia]
MAISSATTSAIEGTTQVNPGAGSTTDEPRPGILRQPTVQFKDTNSPAHLPIDEYSQGMLGSPIIPIKNRTGTSETEVSKASSKLEERWKRQTVLSFDGGGIRGYSSLLVLKEIMKEVEKIEKEKDATVDSSFHPEDYVTPHNTRNTPEPGKGNFNSQQDQKADESCRYFPCHYFDYIGGTSTGGLIAIMLGRLRMGIGQCLEEYENFGGEIFGHPRWFSIRGPLPSFKEKYNGKRLRNVVETVVENRSSSEQKAVGAGYFGSAKELCKTIVVAYRWTDDSSAPRYGKEVFDGIAVPNSPRAAPTESGAYLFRSYDHWGEPSKNGRRRNIFERNPGPADNIPIWQVARATTAAPTYFDPVAIQNNTFGDGGLGSNNPVQEIFWEVATMHGNNGSVIDLIVSIGTGQADPVKLHSSGPKKILSYHNATKALATDSEEKHIAMEALIENIPGLESVNYLRFNLPREQGLKNMKLDEWKREGQRRPTKRGLRRREESTLDKIKRLTQDYCKRDDVREDIRKVAEKLGSAIGAQ